MNLCSKVVLGNLINSWGLWLYRPFNKAGGVVAYKNEMASPRDFTQNHAVKQPLNRI